MTGPILVAGRRSGQDRDRIRDAAGDAEVLFADTLDDLADRLPDAVAIAGGAKPSVLAAAPRLEWVHSWAAGADSDLTPEMRASAVTLTSSVGNGAIPLAEHSMLLMMMLNRDVPRWMTAQRERRWDRFTHGELAGLTVGLFGVGHAGADLAAKARAFHMRVLGCRRNADEPVDGVERMYAPDELHAFLAECDMVVVTAPITEATRGVFDDAAFAAMKSTAFFVCISRGGIADDDALLRALESGQIAGAGLDAHGLEPLPADSPFWTAPNTIVTPHNGATTASTAARGVDIFVDNLRRFVAGEPLVNVVDKVAGY
ncbi:MAG: D-2-hydroxyacid dehydrogenase [Microbacteriaceae bacterium]